MTQKMKKKSSGFQRGFLLAADKSNNKSKRRSYGSQAVIGNRPSSVKSPSSQALLDVASSKPGLLFVEKPNEESDKVESLNIHNAHGGIDNDLVLSQPARRHLIQEVTADETDTDNVKDEPNARTETKSKLSIDSERTRPSNEFLMVEVASRSTNMREKAVERVLESEAARDSVHSSRETCPEKLTSSPSEESADVSLDPNAYMLVTRYMSQLLWESKRSRSVDVQANSEVLLNMCGQAGGLWVTVWETILEDIAMKQSPILLLLGTLLLRNESTEHVAIDSLISFLEKIVSDDRRDRILALGVANLVRETMWRLLEDSQMPSQAWRCRVAPKLAKLVTSRSSSDRSVLLQTCMTAAYDVFAVVASVITLRQCVDHVVSDDLECSIPWIESLLHVQEAWTQGAMKGTAKQENIESASRRQCILAVLKDWRRTVSKTKSAFDAARICASDQAAGRSLVAKALCVQLTGFRIDGKSESCILGGIRQTVSHDPCNVTADEIVVSLLKAEALLHSIRETTNEVEIEKLDEALHLIVRGVLSWLGQSKRHLKNILAFAPSAASNEKDVVGLCLSLLRASSNDTVDLSVAILNRLWSTSQGVPPDIVAGGTGSERIFPSSFTSLLDQLHESTDCSGSEDRALCTLVKRCIQVGGRCFLEALIARNGLRASSVDIMAMLLLEPDGQCVLNDNGVVKDVKNSVTQYAAEILLDNIRESLTVQQKSLALPELFSRIPLSSTLPKLISALAALVTIRGPASPSLARAAVAGCLKDIMLCHVTNESDRLAHVTVESLIAVRERMSASMEVDIQQDVDELVKKTCQSFSVSWRKELLKNSPDDKAFGTLVVSVGREMFRLSANEVPLTLLACLVGDGRELDESSSDERIRIKYTVHALLVAATEELSRVESVAFGSRSDGTGELCSRLSPLLLLRRVPGIYFQVAWSHQNERRERVLPLTSLADHLAIRLDICSVTSKLHFSPVERKLAAEIAGRSLPFYGPDRHSSCFHRICVPAFSSLIDSLGSSLTACSLETIRRARAALYSVCHYLSVVSDEADGLGLVEVSWFVVHTLNSRTLSEGIEGLDELYAGCVDFIALCLEAPMLRSTIKNGKSGPLISMMSEVDQPSSEEHLSVSSALHRINAAFRSLLLTGAPTDSWLRLTRNPFRIKPSSTGLRVEATVCLWNAFISVSKRCTMDNGLLAKWAKATAPWVVDWGTSVSVDCKSASRHPGCMGAALQVVFILVTRTKSTNCLASGKSSGRDAVHAGIHGAHKWALTSVQTSEPSQSYASTLMRMAGLKLLLALITMDDVDKDGNRTHLSQCISPGEMGETFSILQGASNLDPDPEFRTLAAHVLSALRITGS